jgi:hypothetical protein
MPRGAFPTFFNWLLFNGNDLRPDSAAPYHCFLAIRPKLLSISEKPAAARRV